MERHMETSLRRATLEYRVYDLGNIKRNTHDPPGEKGALNNVWSENKLGSKVIEILIRDTLMPIGRSDNSEKSESRSHPNSLRK
jgi:hypothetical protein